ncbi:MAG TPA: SulP family inorganic anion transporter [Bryobacteraceae bacterium]|nr:SulP family inorganic anion transporter [Bryobacteraceae bacterium]
MKKELLGADLLGSVVVFLVALPLCMGIAIASGVPPAAGLVTGILGGIVVGSLSGCPLQVSGPAAGLSVIVYQIIQEHGLAMLGPIVLLAGLIQVAAGLLKAGQFFRSISPAVIHGMLAGIGALIFAAQFHVMVDHTPKSSGLANFAAIPESVALLFQDLDHDHHMAAIVGFVTLGTMLAWTWLAKGKLKTVPGALIGVVSGTALAQFGQWHIHYVKLPENLMDSLTFTHPAGIAGLFSMEILWESLALAFIASAETLLSAAAVDQMAKGHQQQKTNYDRELFSQGVGNTICGILGSLPMTGVIVRSAANVNAGSKSRMSTIFHGFWLLLLIVAFPSVLQLVPTASLAAILVFTGIKLLDIPTFRHLNRYGWDVALIAGLTTVTIVCSSLLTGIVLGIVLSIVKLLWAISSLEVIVDKDPMSDRMDVQFRGSASFVNLPRFTDALEALPESAETHIHVRGLHYIDHAAMEALASWERSRTSRGAQIFVAWDELMSFYNEKNLKPSNMRVETPIH